jgi:phosphoglycerate kinase
MKTLRDFEWEDKRVLVRCDFNVPLSDEGNILDDFRIEKTIPTIEFLKERGAKIILLSHLGRPQEDLLNVKNYSLRPVAKKIEELLEAPVYFLPDCLGENTKREIEQMGRGEIRK